MSKGNTVAISAKSRNLALTWSNTPEGYITASGESSSRIQAAPEPDQWGGLRSVEQELERARSINSGGVWWTKSLWVGKRRVVGPELTILLAMLRDGRTVEVELAQEDATHA